MQSYECMLVAIMISTKKLNLSNQTYNKMVLFTHFEMLRNTTVAFNITFSFFPEGQTSIWFLSRCYAMSASENSKSTEIHIGILSKYASFNRHNYTYL